MKRIVLLTTLLICGAAFSGMVMGSLIVPGTPTDTAYVFAFHDFSTLMDTAFFYTLALPPDYDFVFDEPGLIDSYDFNVMALIPSGLPPSSGDPAGQYPDNPFQITGGLISGIDVELAVVGGTNVVVSYPGNPDSLKIDIYNQYPMLMGGAPTLDGTWELSDTLASIDSIPAGPKSAIIWSDINGNGYCDTTGFVQEPHAWYDNVLDGIFIVGGGVFNAIDFDLGTGNVSERIESPKELGIRCFPSPFNSAVSILVAGNGEPIELDIYDLRGQHVDKIAQSDGFSGFSLVRYSPKADMPGGMYLVKATAGGETKTQKIIYMK